MLFKCMTCGTEVQRSEKFRELNVYCSRSCAAKQTRNRKGTGKSERASKTKPCLSCGSMCYRMYCNTYCQQAHTWRLKMVEIVKADGNGFSSWALKRYLLNTQPRICQICKRDEHVNAPIPLVMDHINGHPFDNSLSNLRLVCPNCDSLQPTFGARNRGNGRKLGALRIGLESQRG